MIFAKGVVYECPVCGREYVAREVVEVKERGDMALPGAG
jgi:predicted RNA-binding Zn-ribbon protein involved in translation (DUF1610 family)